MVDKESGVVVRSPRHEHAQGEQVMTAPPDTPPPTTKRWHAWAGIALFLAALALTSWIAGGDPALGTTTTVRASAFGPGLYGNRMACGGRLEPGSRGVAHKTLPCGTRVAITYRGRAVIVRVVDRGPYIPGRSYDLTARTARDLCSCTPRAWGVRNVTAKINPDVTLIPAVSGGG